MAKLLCRRAFDPAVYPIPVDLHNLLLGSGWEDVSHGNDVCPSFEMRRGQGEAQTEWRLWVDAARVRDRECGGRRFTMTREMGPDAEIMHDVVWSTEGEREAYAGVLGMGGAK